MTPEPAPEIEEDNSEAVAEFAKLSPEQQAEDEAATNEGLADVAAGRTVSAQAVRRWIESLGTDHELPPPECGE